MNIKRNCDICGAEYWAQNAKSKYCSDDCKRVAYKERQRKFNETHPGYHAEKTREWKENNPERFKELQKRRNDSEEYKESRRNEWRSKHELVERVFECQVCGKPFTTWRNSKNFCSSDCRTQYMNRRSHKNRVTEDKYIDTDITVKRLFDRDGGVCYLCGQLCDLNDYNANGGTVICGNNYPSIDHIVPVSRGGEHSWNNVRLAHRRCNSIKGNRIIQI